MSIEAVARALNDAGVAFIVVGGVAVAAHGFVRHTQDLDIVIRLEPDSIRAAFGALAGLGYLPRVPVTVDSFANSEQRNRWVGEKGMMVLSFHSDLQRDTPIDLFVTEPFDFAQELAAAKVVHVAQDVPMRILRLETLLKLKEQAGRPIDIADVAELRRLHSGASNA